MVYLALKLLELYLVISQENDNMDDDDKLDYMKNTGFKVSNDGLIAKYNKAPNIEGVRKNRTISKVL